MKKLFRKVLVANRGEIAVRVFRACRELGISTIAVYSDADRDAIHARYADEAFHIGPAPPSESDLQLEKIVKLAADHGAEAIHPGYGFLSERPHFPEVCEAHGIAFIGPPAAAMRAMGSKLEAKALARKHGVPVTPGSEAIDDPHKAAEIARGIGFPVIVKPSGGGGGIGIKAVEAAGYVNAGTVEFIFSEGDFYFLEVNARLQVEHPITEQVTGVDLVKEQIRVAAGHPLSFGQEDVHWKGHAIEMRINAEDPARKFIPNPRRISRWVAPAGPGVRVDSGFGPGSEVPPNYDSLVAKLIVGGADRAEAIARGRRALREFVLVGPATTIPYHRAILESPDFLAGNLSTRFIDDHPELLEEMKRFLGETSPMDYGSDARAVAAAAAAVAVVVRSA